MTTPSKENEDLPCLSNFWIGEFLRRFKQGIISPLSAREELINITDKLVDEASKQGREEGIEESACILDKHCNEGFIIAAKIRKLKEM